MPGAMDRVLDELIRSMDGCAPCASMGEAHQLVCSKLLEIGEKKQLPPALIQRIGNDQLSTAHGWNNLEGDPCFRDFGTDRTLRVNLHRNGTIVIQSLSQPAGEVLLVKLGSDNAFHSSEPGLLQ